MSSAICGARILTPDERIETGTVFFDQSGRITEIGTGVEPPPGAEVTEARGLTLAPGFIDLHVHGGGGLSLATRDPEELRSYARWAVAHGVTSFLPTICADDVHEGLEFTRTAATATGPVEGGASVLGVNLEGPFVSPQRRGALPVAWVAPPDVGLFQRFVEASDGDLKMVTLAPDLPDVTDIARAAVATGIVVAVGHSDATYEEALRGFQAGASHVTHAFNGMRPFHHRDPGPVLAALDSPQVTLEVIADGAHLHPATVRAIVRAAGTERVVLITDAVPPAGQAEGSFRLDDKEATLAGDRVLLPDGTIAGSATTMAGIVRNVVDWGVASLPEAIRMASTVPARVLGLSDRKGRIAPGFDADLVALDSALDIAMTWVAGRLVYARGERFN
jgi:N-acetylglucosamine-6-phosphate deacetylase